jgi:hypothetical protein
VAAYRARSGGLEAQYAAVARGGGVVDLARSCGLPLDTPLNRYPLLARDREQRDGLSQQLQGYGASRFYGSVLPDVPGLQEVLGAADPCPRAREFADRVLTLPTHDGVYPLDVAAIGRVLSQNRLQADTPIREIA